MSLPFIKVEICNYALKHSLKNGLTAISMPNYRLQRLHYWVRNLAASLVVWQQPTWLHFSNILPSLGDYAACTEINRNIQQDELQGRAFDNQIY
jgi:hypothetical protein